MNSQTTKKYHRFEPTIRNTNRAWPDQYIEHPPTWCSVDLRDGNQALVTPMTPERKLRMFHMLRDIGFREIEIGFPASAQVEFDFARTLIRDGHIPEDVNVQVLCQAREHLIRETFRALEGAKRAIFHVYNSTNELQRRVVFRKSRDEIKDIAVRAVRLIKELTAQTDTDITLQYSPESFSATETEFALEVCEAVMDVWEPHAKKPVILNLPATVEVSTPNIFADQVEWFIRNLRERDKAIVSIHPHNDRGTAVAAAEFALMAGADRMEGTLFGNGERTGNVDIVTLALNMHTQGVDPGLDFHDINRVRDVYQETTLMRVPERQPYVGELVFTAFSGSHQDAIRKGMAVLDTRGDWEVPYLPMDPGDVGRDYQAIIRVNSQSGKGGAAYVLEGMGYRLPDEMLPEFGAAVQARAEAKGDVLSPEEILAVFQDDFLFRAGALEFLNFSGRMNGSETDEDGTGGFSGTLRYRRDNRTLEASAAGNGPLDACKQALISAIADEDGPVPVILDYREHALSPGSRAKAAAYVRVALEPAGESGGGQHNGRSTWGAGVDANLTIASIRALFSAMNRLG